MVRDRQTLRPGAVCPSQRGPRSACAPLYDPETTRDKGVPAWSKNSFHLSQTVVMLGVLFVSGTFAK